MFLQRTLFNSFLAGFLHNCTTPQQEQMQGELAWGEKDHLLQALSAVSTHHFGKFIQSWSVWSNTWLGFLLSVCPSVGNICTFVHLPSLLTIALTLVRQRKRKLVLSSISHRREGSTGKVECSCCSVLGSGGSGLVSGGAVATDASVRWRRRRRRQKTQQSNTSNQTIASTTITKTAAAGAVRSWALVARPWALVVLSLAPMLLHDDAGGVDNKNNATIK